MPMRSIVVDKVSRPKTATDRTSTPDVLSIRLQPLRRRSRASRRSRWQTFRRLPVSGLLCDRGTTHELTEQLAKEFSVIN